MCGVAGCWQGEADVEAMLNRIAHRGPDARGTLTVGDVTHGHVRLAIMDPHNERANQPFEYTGGVLSYVGELWNFRELREELEGSCYEFRTECDTEVVAAMLDYWGVEAALTRMDGQFAFAWTSRDGETYLARDRYGEVPLYYLDVPAASLFEAGGMMWSSERKAWAERGSEAEPVPAGAFWKLGEDRPRRYHDPRAVALDRAWVVEDRAEYVRRILERSIDRRLQADVPVCCLISGGVDSATILALVKERMPDVVAYTIVFDPNSEDRQQAAYVARELGVELREVPVPDPDDDLIRAAIGSIEITMKAQIEIALHCLPLAQRIYADGYRVVLSGEGADELFGGYGMLVRHSKKNGGRDWPLTRLEGIEKMARGNFVRINKAFMAHGVEARTPFMDAELIRAVLPLYRDECPEQKVLLREAVVGLLPEATRLRRKVSFQSGSGMRDHIAHSLEGDQQKVYNQMARDLFGGIPRG